MANNHPDRIALDRIKEARRIGATSLDLRGLGLTAVPESLGLLAGLRLLNLSYNQLTAVPESLGQFAGLRLLFLNNNQLTAVPESLGQLDGLLLLYLNNNQLTAVPESLGQLAGLQELDLNNNQLTAVPESLGQLAGLHELYLSNNQLTAVPESLGQLAGLQKLFLHGNPALGIPPEILGPPWEDVVEGKGQPAKPADILQYYFRIQQTRTRRLNEAKVLLVGQGGVGKTSLVNRLVHNRYDPHEAKTEGIKIAPWPIPGKRDGDREAEPIRLNVWDFGGQEIMHATHQFFLTKRSLYLVVLDAREGETKGNIHYWLKIVQSYGGDAPVIVVINKSEEHPLELNETRLSKDYAPNLHGFVQVSCATGAGIAELRAAIEEQVHALPHVSDALPVSFFEIKEKLAELARTKNFIDRADYAKLCRKHGVTQQSEQDVLIRFLHDLGTVLNFHDPESPYDLRDTNILNPLWVTGGVYKILNNIELMRQEGVLETARLGSILDNSKSYPPKRHKFIVEMMRKFELCFAFPDSAGRRLLVPELLRPNEPDLDWKPAEALNFEYHYNVLPGGIISRFIVRMHYNLTSKPTYWRSGVVLEIQGNRALVRGDADAKRVYIAVLGPEPGRRRALTVIRDAFKAIHATIPKIVATEKVPLPDDPGVAVDYHHLLKLEGLGIDRFLPEGAERQYGVRELLEGVEPRGGRRHPGDKVKVLFLAANPSGTDPLRLDTEAREIETKIRASKYPEALELITKWAVRPDDLLQYLNQHEPHVVHFSGHGAGSEPGGRSRDMRATSPEDGEIILVGADGRPRPVPGAALAGMFRVLKDNIRVVVLNACYSQSQARAIIEHVECAIGMNRAIGDEAAIAFAASFYRAIGFGRSVERAFEEGKTALRLEGIPEDQTPELLVRTGVDPSQVVLLP